MALDLTSAFNAMMHFAPVGAQAYAGYGQGVNLREREFQEQQAKKSAETDRRRQLDQRQAQIDLEKANQEFLHRQRQEAQEREKQEAETLRTALGGRVAEHTDVFSGVDLASAPLATLKRLDERIREAERDAREHQQARELIGYRESFGSGETRGDRSDRRSTALTRMENMLESGAPREQVQEVMTRSFHEFNDVWTIDDLAEIERKVDARRRSQPDPRAEQRRAIRTATGRTPVNDFERAIEDALLEGQSPDQLYAEMRAAGQPEAAIAAARQYIGVAAPRFGR